MLSKSLYVAIFFVIALTYAPVSQAQTDLTDLSLEELGAIQPDEVFSASKYIQKKNLSPNAISIITRKDIQKYGFRTLAEALQSQSGFYVTNDRNFPQLGVRGYGRPSDYNARILLLINGIKINDPAYDSAPIGGNFPLDMELVERIEIIRGPSSSIYGNNAFFGVINVITRSARFLPTGEAQIRAEGNRGFKQYATASKKWGDDDSAALSYSRYTTHGEKSLYFSEFDSPNNNNGIAEDLDAEHWGNFYSDLRTDQFRLTTGISDFQRKVPTAPFQTIFGDNRNQSLEKKIFTTLSFNEKLNEHSLITATVGYDRYRFVGDYPYAESSSSIVNRDNALTSRISSELQLVSSLNDHTLLLGTRWENTYQSEQKNYDLAPNYTSYFDDSRTLRTIGLYAQDQWKINDRWSLTSGLRLDRHPELDALISPRIALIYNIDEKSRIKAIYGRAFRAPNSFELYYKVPNQEGNPRLDHETIDTAELIYENSFYSWMANSINFYSYWARDLISQEYTSKDSDIGFNNLSGARTFGVNTETKLSLKEETELIFAYTYTQSIDQETDTTLTNSPRHQLQSRVTTPLAYTWNLSVDYWLLSPRNSPRGGKVETSSTLNMNIQKSLFNNHAITRIGMRNLLNQTYKDPASLEHTQTSLEQNGRLFWADITFQLD